MADHRQETGFQRAVRVLRPSVFLRMPCAVRIDVVVDLWWVGIQMCLMIIIGVPWWFTISWITAGSLGVLISYLGWVRYVEADRYVVEGRAHCGCVHRWKWDTDHSLWVPAGIVEASDQCLTEAR